MASSGIVDSLCSISPSYSPKQFKNQTLNSQFVSSSSFLKLKKQSVFLKLQVLRLTRRNCRSFPVVFAAQFNFFKVVPRVYWLGLLQGTCRNGESNMPESSQHLYHLPLENEFQSLLPHLQSVNYQFNQVLQTALKVGKDGVEAGTNLVPDSVPRPVARIAVTVVALSISVFVLKSFLSTALFALATMGFVYFIFIALNKDQGPRGSGDASSSEDPLEEARRIMEKYK